MKKKKQQNVALPTTSTTTSDLKFLIHDHAVFFDKLVELIPAKFYLPNDADDSKPWFQGLSKAAKASAKQQTRENIKKARRDRLDPEKSHTTTLDLLKQSVLNENTISSDDEGEEIEIKIKPIPDLDGEGDNRSVTYEELQQRLHCKLEELRSNRGQGKRSMNERRDLSQKKRKRSDEIVHRTGTDGNLGKSEGDIEKEVEEATKGIEFGKVKMGGEDGGFGNKRKKMKGSRTKELERANELQKAKKDPERGEIVAKKHSWMAATSRAMGVKVHDDPKLLKRSIQKDKKRHKKNVGKWKERVESREKLKEEKQQKRSGNIAERINQKKMRKIAKREKKLMRPGFEGRKEGYIGED